MTPEAAKRYRNWIRRAKVTLSLFPGQRFVHLSQLQLDLQQLLADVKLRRGGVSTAVANEQEFGDNPISFRVQRSQLLSTPPIQSEKSGKKFN